MKAFDSLLWLIPAGQKENQIGRYKKFGIKLNTIDKTADYDTDNFKEVSNKGSKKAWARLLQKIYEADPYICPYRSSGMKIIAVIMDKEAIEKIFNHFDKKRASLEEKVTS